MTYQDWGCDPLAAECESCLNALCNRCEEEFRKKPGDKENTGSQEETCLDFPEPDCDSCELEKKPDCSHCTIIIEVCRSCGQNKTCEFKIC